MDAFKKPMHEEVPWKELADAGLFLFVNQLLHLFGYALVREEKDGEIIHVYPARCRFRGFDNETVGDAYKRLTKHMAARMPELLEDVQDQPVARKFWEGRPWSDILAYLESKGRKIPDSPHEKEELWAYLDGPQGVEFVEFCTARDLVGVDGEVTGVTGRAYAWQYLQDLGCPNALLETAVEAFIEQTPAIGWPLPVLSEDDKTNAAGRLDRWSIRRALEGWWFHQVIPEAVPVGAASSDGCACRLQTAPIGHLTPHCIRPRGEPSWR